ncbi:hypothetical protein NC651_024528 [Populus alba x Populus x berolinensis]|nr:hypothetical protein NC651_024528 [Populus alba x Populus x berolinensis]
MIFSYFPCHGRIQGTKTCYSVMPMNVLYCSFACLLPLRSKDPDLYNSFGLFQPSGTQIWRSRGDLGCLA